MSDDQHPRPQNQWDLIYQLILRLLSRVTWRELSLLLIGMTTGFLLSMHFVGQKPLNNADDALQSSIDLQRKLNAQILDRLEAMNHKHASSIAEMKKELEGELTNVHDVIGRSLSDLADNTRGETSTIPSYSYVAGQVSPSLRNQVLRDIRELEIHIETYGSINLNGYSAPEAMLIRIRVILRHLGLVESLEESRDDTRLLVKNLQRRATEVGYVKFKETHLGFVGKRTIALFRRLIMSNTKIACGNASSECINRLLFN